eukprot:g9222.t1
MSRLLRIEKLRAKQPLCLNDRFLVSPVWRRNGILLMSGQRQRQRPAKTLVSNGHLQMSKAPPEELLDPTQETFELTAESGAFAGFLNFIKSWITQIKTDVNEMDPEVINGQIRKTMKQMRMVSLTMPLASASTGVQSLVIITKAVSSFISVYLLLLFVRVLLSWFPTFRWDRNPWIILRQVTDPYLNLFRGLIPPLLGTIDFTPLLGFIILQWLSGILIVSEDEEYW